MLIRSRVSGWLDWGMEVRSGDTLSLEYTDSKNKLKSIALSKLEVVDLSLRYITAGRLPVFTMLLMYLKIL